MSTMRERLGLGGDLERRTFASFYPEDQPPKYRGSMVAALATARSFLDRPRTLVFQGPNGVGKTHLAVGIGNALLEKYGGASAPVLFVTFQDALLKIRRTYQEGYQGMGESWWLARWASIPVLILDEVGQAGLEDRPSEFTRKIGYAIIDARYRRGGKPIVMTTNKSGSELCDWITDSALDRLMEMGEFVVMRGESWRRNRPRS